MRSTSVTSTSLRRSLRAAARPPKPPPTITTRRRPPLASDGTGGLLCGWSHREPLKQVVGDAQPVGHRRQSRVDRADAGEEARVDYVQVVELVRLAVNIQHGGSRVA